MDKSGLLKRKKTTHERDYVTVHNLVAQNKNLSFEARGLLIMLLSLPEDWVLHKSWITKEYKIGREKMKRIFNELEKNGYFVPMEMVRKDGKFVGKNYLIHDRPCNDVKEISPMYRNPSTVEPTAENGTTKKDISIKSTYKEKENNNNVEKFGNFPSGDSDAIKLMIFGHE